MLRYFLSYDTKITWKSCYLVGNAKILIYINPMLLSPLNKVTSIYVKH